MTDDEKSAFEQQQLEAEPILNNEQLLDFNIRSKNVKWSEYIVPLQSRKSPVYLKQHFNALSSYREAIGDSNRRELLLCHDLMGNYLEDKHFNSSKKYDSYRYYHWSTVDIFCYFSHKYITIPPAGWINAAHKHGVPVLGTFITENIDGAERLREVLKSTEMMDDIVRAMVKLCKHFGFEGWLLNVECPLPSSFVENLCYFIQKLRQEVNENVPNGRIIWYDSVIDNGELKWQNELNDKNVRFYLLSRRILLNYGWDEKSMKVTSDLCDVNDKSKIYFGIDVFGRGQIAKFKTRKTLAQIAAENFSVGIFAPSWTYETLRNYGYNIALPCGSDYVNESFLQRNEKFWWTLWEYLATYPYSALPFYTDFCLGSGKNDYRYGKPIASEEKPFYNLSRQSLQPSVPLYMVATRNYDNAFNGGSCLKIDQSNQSFRIMVTDFQIKYSGLVFAYAFKMHQEDNQNDPQADEQQQKYANQFDCILRISDGSSSRNCYLFLGDYQNEKIMYKGRCYISPFNISTYHSLLEGPLKSPQIPTNRMESDLNGWQIRYYVMIFDGPVNIKDIGGLYRKLPQSDCTAYLGAIYLNEFDAQHYQFPSDSNATKIDAYNKILFG